MAPETEPLRLDFDTRVAILRSRLEMGPCDLVCLDAAFQSCAPPDEILVLGFDPEIIRDYSAGEVNERLAVEDTTAVMSAVLGARETGVGTASMTVKEAGDPAGVTMVDFTEEYGALIIVSTQVDPDVMDFEGAGSASLRPRRALLHRDRFANFVWVGPEVEALLGYPADELLGRSAPAFLHPDDHDRGIKGWFAMLTGHGDARHRVRWRTADGGWRWIEMTHENKFDELGYSETELLDVDDEMVALARARAGEMEFHTLTEALPSGVVRLNTDREVVYVNPWLRELTGWDEDLETSFLLETIHPEDRGLIIRAVIRTEAGEQSDLQVRLKTALGAPRKCKVRIRPLSPDGKHAGAIASIEDVTESASLQEELRRQAETDALTGVANRSTLTRQLDALVAEGSQLALLFFDLDGFKLVNDGLGHDAGDDLLVDVARRAKALLRPSDLIARVGGDEFVVVCPWATSLQDATQIADRLIDAVRHAADWSGASTSVNCSVGIAIHDGTTQVTADELIVNADMAMYEAKNGGGGCWKTYNPGLRKAATQSFELQRAMADAFRANEFQLHVQPIKDLESGSTVAIECLLRWFDQPGGEVSTARLIEIAEQSGLIVPLGRWVLDNGCAIAARAAAVGLDDLRVSVNVSVRQLSQDGFERDLADAVARHRIDPRQLILEVTETAFVGNDGNVVDTLRSIASTGCTIALDDFGTGYSSLNQVRLMPVSMLKIDRSYTADLGIDPGATAISRSLVGLCEDLNIELVAEGVETEAQREIAATMGILLGQGYHLDRPMSVDAFFSGQRSAVFGSEPG